MQRLRVKCLMHKIIDTKMLSTSGYALEQFFEPEFRNKRRYNGQLYDSSKWRRYLRDGNMPGEKSLKLIDAKAPNATRTFSSPFWEAIRQEKRNQSEWMKFYDTFDIEIKSLVFEFLANPFSLDDIKFYKRPLNNLIRIGNDQAVAALIGLLRQFDTKVFIRVDIENNLYNIIFNFFSRFCPLEFLPELYAYLYANILTTTQKRYGTSPWPNSIREVEQMVWIEQKNVLLAEDLGLLDQYTLQNEFYYWKLRGDRHLIVREIADMLYDPNVGPDAPHTKKGLRWLVKKLNKNRPMDHQLSPKFFDYKC